MGCIPLASLQYALLVAVISPTAFIPQEIICVRAFKGSSQHRNNVFHSRNLVEAAEDETPSSNSDAAGRGTAVSLLSVSMPLLSGRYEIDGDAETVWQRPPSTSPLRAVLFVAHGCRHSALDWWPKSESCPKCSGLPEEMNITLHSLLRGYVVVAVSPASKNASKCWQRSQGQVPSGARKIPSDWRRVSSALERLMGREGLMSLPLYMLGVSSGGAFVMGLPHRLPRSVAGLVVQVMGVAPGFLEHYRSRRRPFPFPPTAFVHMLRDNKTAARVAANVEELRTARIRTLELAVLPRPLTPLYLVQRCAPEVDEQTSRAVYDALRAANITDEYGYLQVNPSEGAEGGGWREALRAAAVPGLEQMRLNPHESPIAEELNLLWADHEVTSEATTDVFDWFEGPRQW